MDETIIDGKWKQVKETLKTKWGKLADDDMAQLNGMRKEEARLGQEPAVAAPGEGERGKDSDV
jgi:uncharacterized protein YjbJ (UPF0337 family)